MSFLMPSSEPTGSKLKTGTYTYQVGSSPSQEPIRTSVSYGIFPYAGSLQELSRLTIYMRPVPKPRETRRDRWAQRKSVMRFRFFRDVVRSSMEHFNFVPSEQLGLVFYMKMPSSLSKKRASQRVHKAHQVRPDLDNLEKAALDALFAEDAVVYMKIALKMWSLDPRIEIWNLK